MGMTRGTPLVADIAAVVVLTGQQGLAAIPVASELTMTDLLTSASDFIYDKLDHAGIDPTVLSNQTVYERAVAWHFLSLLAENGDLTVGGETATESAGRYQRRSDDMFASVQPKSTATDMPNVGDTFLPRIGNVTKKSQVTADKFYDDIARRF